MSTANILTKHIAILVKKHAIHIVPNIEETRMVSGTLWVAYGQSCIAVDCKQVEMSTWVRRTAEVGKWNTDVKELGRKVRESYRTYLCQFTLSVLLTQKNQQKTVAVWQIFMSSGKLLQNEKRTNCNAYVHSDNEIKRLLITPKLRSFGNKSPILKGTVAGENEVTDTFVSQAAAGYLWSGIILDNHIRKQVVHRTLDLLCLYYPRLNLPSNSFKSEVAWLTNLNMKIGAQFIRI